MSWPLKRSGDSVTVLAKEKDCLIIIDKVYISVKPITGHIPDRMLDNNIRTREEYQFADATQEMIKRGSRFKTYNVSSWYDCVHAGSLLETNRVLLDEKENSNDTYDIIDSVWKGSIDHE